MSYTKSYYHIVFRTHHSNRTLTEEHERGLYMYVFVTCKSMGVKLWRVNSMPDHIHLLVSIPPNMSISAFVKSIKQTMGNYIKGHRMEFPNFDGWADGYCSITYCDRERDTIIEYIKNQKYHHRRISLGEEMKALFLEAGVEINDTYFTRDWIE